MAVLTAMNKVHHYDVVSVLHQPQCQTLYRLITYVLVSERMSLWGIYSGLSPLEANTLIELICIN